MTIDPTVTVYSNQHRGAPYLFSPVGCHREQWMLDSFSLENELREDWWCVEPGDAVLDVGAGFGSYSLAALAAGASRVIGVEPAKEEFFSLCQNVSINKDFDERFFGIPLVCHEAGGRVIAFSEKAHSCLPSKSDYESRLTTTVDELAGRFVPFPDRLKWLKIDVEGMELHVLRGAVSTLVKHRPNVLVECHAGIDVRLPEMVTEIMNTHAGYRCETRTGEGVNDIWQLWKPER